MLFIIFMWLGTSYVVHCAWARILVHMHLYKVSRRHGGGKGEVGGGTCVCLLHVHVPTLAVINCMCFLLDVFV